ncbi:MAG TPA: adenylate/guanylate cyclase domain-containing protein [Solirubrobacteraceae bacterium]|jgi:adenylate cyclase|nr:adenylate/guanylate cyclase domain-containing protein [Solirubrobacteraceae bacterium]
MGRARWRRRKSALLVGMAMFAAGVGVAAYATHLLRRSELQTIDARFSIRGDHRPSPDVLFVAINPQAEEELAAHRLDSRSPLPRRYDAQVVDRLARAGAKVIALDMEFNQLTDEADDIALIEALERAHGKTVLATLNVEPDGATTILGGESSLKQIGARPSEVRLTLDPDGSVRRFARAYNRLGSLPVVATEVMTGRRVAASTFESGTLPIDYAGPAETFRSISYAKVLRGEFNPATVRGKLVIVGAASPILQDLHATPTSGGTMPGPEIWANAAATLLEGVPLTDAPGWLDVLLIVALGVAVPLGSLRLARWRAMVDAVALAVVFTIATQIAFNSGWIWTFVYPLLALAIGTLGTLAVLYVGEAIERERVHDLFSRFVPADVVDQVVASAGEDLRLRGVELDCTVLFSDLRGFTSFSESQSPEHVIEVVNHYLNEMTEAIMAAGGTLIAYMGDGIMAAFGAPLAQEDHADRALRAAREMIGVRLARFNGWLAEEGHGESFAMGVGLNSGPVMAGNVGSERRVEYTTIGDTTNTASRLEGMTKGSGHMLFCAQSTRDRMKEPPADLVLVGELEVRGREARLPVWTLADVPPAAPPQRADEAGTTTRAEAPTLAQADGAGENGAGDDAHSPPAAPQSSSGAPASGL